ncbi:MAG: hypothetical protein AB7I04_04375 [Pseudomonadales bacterium]
MVFRLQGQSTGGRVATWSTAELRDRPARDAWQAMLDRLADVLD